MYSVEDISAFAGIEPKKYRRGETEDDSSALGLFERAIYELDGEAWDAVHTLFNPQVLVWCRKMSRNAVDVEDMTSLTWEKFFRYFGPEKLTAARHIGAVLRYLKACAASAGIDMLRQQHRGYQELNAWDTEDATATFPDLADSGASVEWEFMAQERRRQLWGIVAENIRSAEERALIRLRYEYDLRPSEIQARRPDLFPDVGDVYRTTRNLLDRLRRSPALRRFTS